MAIAGGGGCDGQCLPNPVPTAMLVCEVVALNNVGGNFGSGNHNSFKVAQLIISQFALGNKFILSGNDQKINIIQPESTSNKLHLELNFEFYSGSSETKKYHYLLNWGSFPDDYPLLDRVFIDFSGKDNFGHGAFSIIFERAEDISGVHDHLIQTHSGKMKCEPVK